MKKDLSTRVREYLVANNVDFTEHSDTDGCPMLRVGAGSRVFTLYPNYLKFNDMTDCIISTTYAPFSIDNDRYSDLCDLVARLNSAQHSGGKLLFSYRNLSLKFEIVIPGALVRSDVESAVHSAVALPGLYFDCIATAVIGVIRSLKTPAEAAVDATEQIRNLDPDRKWEFDGTVNGCGFAERSAKKRKGKRGRK